MAQRENELTEPLVKYFESEMAQLKWSQADVVRKAKLDAGVVSRTLRRETAPDLLTLHGFAAALGISLEEMQKRAVLASLYEAQETGPGVPQDARSGVGTPAALERGLLVGLVRDALMGAIERALERDELEHTRRGHRILGTAFLGLAVELRKSDMDVDDLVLVSHDLLKRAEQG